MPLEERKLLTLRSTQVLRLFLVGSYLPILSVLHSVGYIIVSPFVFFIFWQITLCVFLFTDCDYPFGIFKLFLYLHLQFVYKRSIKVENSLLNKRFSIYILHKFHFYTIITITNNLSIRKLVRHNWSRKHVHFLEANSRPLFIIPRKLVSKWPNSFKWDSFLSLTDKKL